MPHNATGPRAIDRADRRAEAIRLRRDGHAIRGIAAQLNVAVGTVHRDLEQVLRDVPAEGIEELRTIELTRLDALQRAVWDAALDGDLRAVDRAVKIIAQRSRLLGLDTPQQVAVAGPTDFDLDAVVRDLVAAATESPARGPWDSEWQAQARQAS